MATGTQSAADATAALASPASKERSGMPVRLRDGTPAWLRACADTPEERAEIVAEDADGSVVGRAEYRRVYGLRAALTLTVDDELWCAGLAEAMIATISSIAAAAAISKLLMQVPLSDERMLVVLVDDFGARCRRDVSYVDVELDAGRHAERIAASRGGATAGGLDGTSAPSGLHGLANAACVVRADAVS
jgi:hypothetical protein